MITKAFSVYDSKATVFGVPFFMGTVGAAVRAFSDLANDVNSMLNKHPSDFVLYEVGSFDDEKGFLMANGPHIHLGLASDFVSLKPQLGSELHRIHGKTPDMEAIRKVIDNPLLSTAEVAANGK